MAEEERDQVRPAEPRRSEPADDGQPCITEPTLTYRTGRLLLRIYLALWHRLVVENAAAIPAQGGFLLVCNHQSFLDIPILSVAVPRHVAFVARESLARSRVLAFLMEQSGSVLVRPGAADRRALRSMLAHLELGDCLAIFPEGSRTRDGSLGDFRGGALLAAQRAGVPIVPAGIRGAFAAYPRDAALPRPARVAVRFGAPIPPADPDALEICRQRILEMVGDGSFRGIPPL
jgi:1-acyl-sn-glycerol-3-phosphate acyltransferase